MLPSVEDDVSRHGPPGDLHRSKGIHVILLDELQWLAGCRLYIAQNGFYRLDKL
jgi:hypothetical protein